MEEKAALKANLQKRAMEILTKEYDWYEDLGKKMDKTFDWSKLGNRDSNLFLGALNSLCKARTLLCDFMDVQHKSLSILKRVINLLRIKIYSYLSGQSHKLSDPALKVYFASFGPFSTNHTLPFSNPDPDSKEDKDGDTSSSLSEKSCITSNTESPEMITRKRKRSPGEEEQSDGSVVIHQPLSQPQPPEMIAKKGKRSSGEEGDVAEEEESSDTYYLKPPIIPEDWNLLSTDYPGYCDHDHSGPNYRFDDYPDAFYFD